MKGNLIKAGIAVAAAIIIIAIVAALVTGYMSAFKPGNNTTSSVTGYSGGGGVRGGGSIPAAAVSPTPPPGAMAGPGEMPPQQMPLQMPPQPVQSQQMPGVSMEPPSQMGPQSQQAMEPTPYLYDAVPSEQAGTPTPQTGGGWEFTGASPMLGSGEGPWFNLAPSASATPVPTQPPTTQQPLFRSPVTSPAEPQPLAYGLTPYEYGWRQVLLKLLEIIPLIFPGYYPDLQWYTTPSAY